MTDMTTITLTAPQLCRTCGDAVLAGEAVYYNQRGEASCLHCGPRLIEEDDA